MLNNFVITQNTPILRFFGCKPAMGTEPVTAGVSWQNTIENVAHRGKRRQLTLIAGWKTKHSIQHYCPGEKRKFENICVARQSKNKNHQQWNVLNEMVEQDNLGDNLL